MTTRHCIHSSRNGSNTGNISNFFKISIPETSVANGNYFRHLSSVSKYQKLSYPQYQYLNLLFDLVSGVRMDYWFSQIFSTFRRLEQGLTLDRNRDVQKRMFDMTARARIHYNVSLFYIFCPAKLPLFLCCILLHQFSRREREDCDIFFSSRSFKFNDNTWKNQSRNQSRIIQPIQQKFILR